MRKLTVRTCEACRKPYNYHYTARRKYCGSCCKKIRTPTRAAFGSLARNCKACKSSFRTTSSVAKYCSRSCYRDFQKKLRARRYKKSVPEPGIYARLSIGSEFIKKVSYHGRHHEWFVKVSNEVAFWKSCKRKAVFIIEQMLERRLSRSEKMNIKFIDGNTLNCNLKNLIITGGKAIRVCLLCGASKLVLASYRAQFPNRCGNCWRKLGAQRRMEGLHKHMLPHISLIKALVGVGEKCCIPFSYRLGGWFHVSSEVIKRIQRGETWKGVRPMAKTEVWKALLSQHDKLKKQASGTLFDRVSILAKVYEDPHYATDMQKSGKSHIEELDKRVSDTCANFTELFQMLRLFPLKRQWTGGDLNAMRLKMLEKLREGNGKKKARAKKTGTRKTATLTEVRELEAEIKRLRAEIKSANQIIKSLENQLEVARETIGSLNETISLFKVSRRTAQAARKVAAK